MTLETKSTKEFRGQAVKLVQQEKRGMRQTARELGVGESSLRAWVERYGQPAATGASPGETSEEKVLRLRKENRVLQMERDVLKKAVVFLAHESR